MSCNCKDDQGNLLLKCNGSCNTKEFIDITEQKNRSELEEIVESIRGIYINIKDLKREIKEQLLHEYKEGFIHGFNEGKQYSD